MISRIAAFLGFPSAGLLGWVLLAGVAAMVAGSVATGIMVHRYDAAIHGKAVADLRGEAAETLADQTGIVLRLMQDQIDQHAKLEDEYADLAAKTDAERARSAGLTADLDAARRSLLDLAGANRRGGGGALGQADAGDDGCAKLRDALSRADAALERLKSGGDEVAEIGQHAVDVATIAARAARAQETARE